MPKLRAHNIATSLDGYAAGPKQTRTDPLGRGGEDLHSWMWQTRTGRASMGQDGGDEGIDDRFLRAGNENIGATIMGRNMFGPIRGEWPDESWTGWWGDEPPYRHDVFVLTHHPRPSVSMSGGTTFHFVTDGIRAALDRAVEAAGGRDVRLGGGAATIREYLRAGLVDELHIAVVPILLGGGERLLDDDLVSTYRVAEFVASEGVAHYRLIR
ncbi:dihydrofolate reductase family protein [Jidongwangia harbinensis]|uniref:dihydrofolate reductase family protein n=1 Tax=Jidongwangia harbinensis TaxID=2878561 RepID=UPI001CD9E5DC|nr:dihydrofolate reductase family protein [Jidongwangia harbinensis]MCA2216791.1 dihydrofolate reductase family protein [Jidongwangia harbinensis]